MCVWGVWWGWQWRGEVAGGRGEGAVFNAITSRTLCQKKFGIKWVDSGNGLALLAQVARNY